MPVPTHRTDCSSKAYPTNYFFCNQEVFYFFCSCGSKVLFDELGSPWPIHRCFDDKTSSILDDLMDVYGTIDQTTLNHLKIYAKEHQLEFNKK